MRDPRLKQYTLTTYNDKDNSSPTFLAFQWFGRDVNEVVNQITLYTKDIYIEDDELIFIKNRNDSYFYTVHIGDYIIIDDKLHVFPLPSKQFAYLFKEKNNG